MNSILQIIKRLYESKSPDDQYEEYLQTHVQGVHEVYTDVLRPVLEEEGISEDILSKIDYLIDHHDDSKRSPEEWSAYRDHFYDPENNPRSHDLKFNLAWNHHQKSNPHHWNYWVLINDVDDPQVEALEMPFEYVIEMLCDWQSAGHHYGNTAYDWYQKQKSKMILHDNTRKLIERYIKYLR